MCTESPLVPLRAILGGGVGITALDADDWRCGAGGIRGRSDIRYGSCTVTDHYQPCMLLESGYLDSLDRPSALSPLVVSFLSCPPLLAAVSALPWLRRI